MGISYNNNIYFNILSLPFLEARFNSIGFKIVSISEKY